MRSSSQLIQVRLFSPWEELTRASTSLLSPLLAPVESANPSLAQAASFPEQLLADYHNHRGQNFLSNILGAARRLQGRVDRVVFVGSKRSLASARMLFRSGCHPYHNEQGRGERAGYPRIYFAGDSLDNDAVQGLLFLLRQSPSGKTPEAAWGLVDLRNKDDLPAADALRELLQTELAAACQNDSVLQTERSLTVSLDRAELSDVQHPPDHFLPRYPQTAEDISAAIPIGYPADRPDPFSAEALLPAALMGLDILRYLQGGTNLLRMLREGTPEVDLLARLLAWFCTTTVDHVGQPGQATVDKPGWEWRIWNDSLLGVQDFLPPSPVSSSRKLPVRFHLTTENWRCDPLFLPPDSNQVFPQKKTLPQLWRETIREAEQFDAEQGNACLELRLPSTQIGALGQLFQFSRMIALFSSPVERGFAL